LSQNATLPASDTLRAEHRYGGSEPPKNDGAYARRVNDNLLVAVHPVVRVHPETGEKGLFVNPGFTSHIVDVSPRESRAILDLLYGEITRPEYTVRFRRMPAPARTALVRRDEVGPLGVAADLGDCLGTQDGAGRRVHCGGDVGVPACEVTVLAASGLLAEILAIAFLVTTRVDGKDLRVALRTFRHG
jgi:hypothetical protein